VVHTVHDVLPLLEPGWYARSERWLSRRAHADLAERSSRILCVSPYVATQVVELLDVDAARVTVVPNGLADRFRVTPATFHPGRSAATADLGVEPGRYLVHVGAITRRKNLVALVAAVAALPPAAVGAGNVEVSQRVADVCLGALAAACPGRVGAANQGTMNNTLIGGSGWVYYETVAGGQGGRPGRPGMSGIQTGMTNTQNTPIEAFERAYPMQVLRYRLRHGSGGAGLAPGGEGIERDLLMLDDVTVSLITERRVSRPWGLAGGDPGAPGENWLLPQGDESRAERLLDKSTIRMRSGDVLRILTPGGGGWGRARPGSVPPTSM